MKHRYSKAKGRARNGARKDMVTLIAQRKSPFPRGLLRIDGGKCHRGLLVFVGDPGRVNSRFIHCF